MSFLGQEADVLWLARPFAYFGLPYRNINTTKINEDIRKHAGGIVALTTPYPTFMIKVAGGKRKSDSKVSYLLASSKDELLPWGIRAKKLLISLSTFAYHKQERNIEFASLSAFVKAMGTKTVQARVRKEWKETLSGLMDANFRYAKPIRYEEELEHYIYDWYDWKNGGRTQPINDYIEQSDFFYDFKIFESFSGWENGSIQLILSEEFYQLCQTNPVALSARAVDEIRSISCLDLYCWCASNSNSFIEELPVRLLHLQFGSTGRLDEFCKTLKRDLKTVKNLWGSPFGYKYDRAVSGKYSHSEPAKLSLRIKLPPVKLPALEKEKATPNYVPPGDIPF